MRSLGANYEQRIEDARELASAALLEWRIDSEVLSRVAKRRRRDRAGQFADEPGGMPGAGPGPKLAAPRPRRRTSVPVPKEHPLGVDFIDVGSDVNRAADLLAQGKKVRLSQKREASVLLSELARRVQEAKEKGEKAPNFDLCKVTVKNTNLFCAESKGIPRVKMPQLGGVPLPGSKGDKLEKDKRGEIDLSEKFRAHLESKGNKVSDETERASYLKASQIELNGGKVAGMVKALEAGTLPPGRIFISDDNYIVDGHHRWAANVGHELGTDTEIQMPVARIDMDIIELLDEANRFAAEWGIPQADVNAPVPPVKAA